ncbi:MAG: hypothetical protein ACLGHM_09720 [Actinomycetes bacterium]
MTARKARLVATPKRHHNGKLDQTGWALSSFSQIGGALRVATAHSRDDRAMLVINSTGTNLFLTPTECRQWAAALEIAAGLPRRPAADPLTAFLNRTYALAEKYKAAASISEEMGDSSDQARSEGYYNALIDACDELSRVIGA